MKKVADLTITWNPGDENQGSGFYDENLSVNKPTTRYYYDGQMCIEEDYTVWVGPFQGQSTEVTRYGVGARGIDWMERSGSGGGVSFPLYDGHGNMIATLSRSGSGSYAVSNARSYDVWGSVRSGSSTGDPNTRYCANLGHKQDDESGLLYMRARYYEPWTGRFITEDPGGDGSNWYVYAGSSPINLCDSTGGKSDPEGDGFDPVYESLGMLNLISDFAWFLAGMPLNQYKALAFRAGLRTLLAMGAKYPWVERFLRSRIWHLANRLTRITTRGLRGGYYAWVIIGGAFAATSACYLELFINARHLAWWDFCFGDE